MGQPAFGGGVAGSVLHPLVALAMLIAIVLMFLLPRQYAITPFLVVTFLTPLGQELYVAGVHVFVVRILILFGCARMAWTKLSSRTGLLGGGFNSVDSIFLVWALARAMAVILVFGGAWGSIIYECGFLWEALGGYFLLRFLIQDEKDIAQTVKTFSAIVMIFAVTMLNEKLRDQNLFGYLGGVPIASAYREGSIRAQGTFGNAIVAGTFASTLLPLFFWLWQSRKSKLAAVAGVIGATVMVLSCASSTPLLAYLAVLLGICFWPIRKKMRMVRWGIVAGLIGLQLVMKAPVWFAIAHVDLVAGNSGYDRAFIIDTFIHHFKDWWLIGTNQAATWGFDMWDLNNQFVAEGETGGLLTFICFILLITRSYKRIGNARKLVEGDRKREWFLWFLGVALFSHIVAFFGISYYDQMKFAWFALFAIIVAATGPILAAETATERPAVGFANSRLGYPPLSPAASAKSHVSNRRSPVI